jgi:methylmalonyl-CoA/ethylmalonyl-CoA epimerase
LATEPKFKLKSINQVGFVVKDLDKSMESYWRNFGIGPWRIYTYGPPLVKQTTYHGKPEQYHMRVALANVGDVMIELIEHLDGSTLYKDFVDQHGEGVQHLGFFVESLDETIKEMEAAGFRVIQSGRGHGVKGDGGFAYLDTADELGTIYEIIEIPSVRHEPERVYPPAQ